MSLEDGDERVTVYFPLPVGEPCPFIAGRFYEARFTEVPE